MGQTFVHSLPVPNPQRQWADPHGSGRSEYLGGVWVLVHGTELCSFQGPALQPRIEPQLLLVLGCIEF